MTKVQEFLQSIKNGSEHVLGYLAHHLRAMGGEHGQALAEALVHDLENAAQPKFDELAHQFLAEAAVHAGPTALLAVCDEFSQHLTQEQQKALGSRIIARGMKFAPNEDHYTVISRTAEGLASELPQAAQRDLGERILLRAQGLNPDQKTQPTVGASAPPPQSVDANGAPVHGEGT